VTFRRDDGIVHGFCMMETTLEQGRVALDEATFDALWAEGRAVSVNDAIELALASLEQTHSVRATAR
jgi:hypothetical protein